MGEEYQVTEVGKPEWSAADKTQIGIVKKGERTGVLLNLEPGKVKRLKTGTVWRKRSSAWWKNTWRSGACWGRNF